MLRLHSRTLFLVGPVLAACSAPTQDTAPGQPLHPAPPEITDITWSCSAKEETWTFGVLTLNWTDNADLYWALDPDYVEVDAVRSKNAASDGSTDELGLTLSIVADWRDVESGSSTAFQCNDATRHALAFRLVVYASAGWAADCRSWGSDPTFFDTVEGAPACDRVWKKGAGS